MGKKKPWENEEKRKWEGTNKDRAAKRKRREIGRGNPNSKFLIQKNKGRNQDYAKAKRNTKGTWKNEDGADDPCWMKRREEKRRE